MATVNTVREQRRRRGEIRDGTRTYERSWYVYRHVDGVLTAIDIDDVLGLVTPTYISIGDTFPDLMGVECTGIEPGLEDDAEVWTVTAQYESPEPGEEEQPDDFNEFISRSGTDSQNETFGPKRSGGGQVVEEAVTEDLDGNPVVNSAGDPFDTPLIVAVTVQVDNVTANEREKPDTNDIGKADGRKLLANISYSEAEHVNKQTGVRTRYFVNSYEVWTHPYRDWARVKVLDRGYRHKFFDAQANEILKIIRDEFGEPINAPALLDGQGFVLGVGGQPHLIQFRVRDEGPLNVPFLN